MYYYLLCAGFSGVLMWNWTRDKRGLIALGLFVAAIIVGFFASTILLVISVNMSQSESLDAFTRGFLWSVIGAFIGWVWPKSKTKADQTKTERAPLVAGGSADGNSHYTPIYKAHPDADKLYADDAFHEWLRVNPRHGRAISGGTPSEIIEAFTAYKHSR